MSQRQGQLLVIKIKIGLPKHGQSGALCYTHTLYGRFHLLKAKKILWCLEDILLYFQPINPTKIS